MLTTEATAIEAPPVVPSHNFITDVRTRLFLTSFTVLFFELICIRWIPAYIRYIGYFSNFILLSAFLGIGLGILISRRSWRLPPFPLMLAFLVIYVWRNKIEVRLNSTDVLYYGAGESIAKSEHYLVLPIVILLVTITMVPLARPLGPLLNALPRLQAYTIDIIGSMAGTAMFFAFAWFSAPPIVWFGALTLLLISLAGPRTIMLGALPILATLIIVVHLQSNTQWSPYYKLTVEPAAEGTGVIINVNNSGQQTATEIEYKESFYRRVYELFPAQEFENTLILGAGSGSDTAVALDYGVPHIDAVEIDPKILDLGKRLNPEHPYQDPRVTTYVNDGRAFMRNTDKRYDLISFALPDSLTLTSGFSNLRLESFLLTKEAIEDARDHLTDDGMVLLYNYYREPWLVDKIAAMMKDVFGQDPYVSTYGGWGRAAVLMAGPKVAELPAALNKPYAELAGRDETRVDVIGEGFYPTVDAPRPATDNWPFLYLKTPVFPKIYVGSLLLLAGIALIGVLIAMPRKALRRFDLHMFFLGAAFILLETKSIVAFGLLFGSTWMVNSLVFFAILTSVLVAILVSSRLQIRRPGILYALLAITLIVNFIVRPERLLFDTPILRYVVAAVMAFTPVFIANVVFARSFRDSETADIAFGSNLLGIMAGGTLEYFALLLGYRALLLIALGLYMFAALLGRYTPFGRVPITPSNSS
ncbi:MAG: spermidine synthase [Acidimicrobiales bacterium]